MCECEKIPNYRCKKWLEILYFNLNIKWSIKKSNKIALKYVWEARENNFLYIQKKAKTNRKNVNDDILLSSSMWGAYHCSVAVDSLFKKRVVSFIDFSFSLHEINFYTEQNRDGHLIFKKVTQKTVFCYYFFIFLKLFYFLLQYLRSCSTNE